MGKFDRIAYGEAPPFVRAMIEVDGERLTALAAEAIIDNLDPWKALERNLPALAFDRGVIYWDETWPEAVRRAWIDRQWLFKARRGTLAAFDMVVAIEREAGRDIRLIETKTPPQGLFLGGSPNKAEWEAYMELLPEIRVFGNSRPGTNDGGGFLDPADGFWDDLFLVPDRGAVLYGRHSVLAQAGKPDVPLTGYAIATTIEYGVVQETERVVIPGRAGAGGVFGQDFWGSFILDGVELAAKVVTYTLDRGYIHERSDLSITYVSPGLVPFSPRYERGSLELPDENALMLDEAFYGDAFLIRDRSSQMAFDRLRLMDPAVEAPTGGMGDYWGDARYGMPPKTLEMMMEVRRVATWGEDFLGNTAFWGQSALIENDLTVYNRALDGAAAAKGLSDTVLIQFDATRPLTFQDGIPLDGTYTFDNRVPRRL